MSTSPLLAASQQLDATRASAMELIRKDVILVNHLRGLLVPLITDLFSDDQVKITFGVIGSVKNEHLTLAEYAAKNPNYLKPERAMPKHDADRIIGATTDVLNLYVRGRDDSQHVKLEIHLRGLDPTNEFSRRYIGWQNWSMPHYGVSANDYETRQRTVVSHSSREHLTTEGVFRFLSPSEAVQCFGETLVRLGR